MHRALTYALARDDDTPNRTEAFNLLIKYLVRLRREGTIDDEGLSQLIRMVSASFIKSEITHTVDRALKKAFAPDRLLRSWK